MAASSIIFRAGYQCRARRGSLYPGRPKDDPCPVIPSAGAICDPDPKGSTPEPDVNNQNELQPAFDGTWNLGGFLNDPPVVPGWPVAAFGRTLPSGRSSPFERNTCGQPDNGVPRQRLEPPQQIRSVWLQLRRKQDLSASAAEDGSDPQSIGWRHGCKHNSPS